MLQLITMHGWAGDQRSWAPWRQVCEPMGWSLQCGDRGYGALPALEPAWSHGCPDGTRVVIAHSLGPHLLPRAVLEDADAVVLLASFGRFIPPGREGRRLEAALERMAAQLDGEQALVMLRAFLCEAAAPDPPSALPPGPVDAPLRPEGRKRLLADLARLRDTDGLPSGFPSDVPVLILEAEADRIVAPRSRELLREALPCATVVGLPGAGHSLLRAPVIPTVTTWLEEAIGRP